MAGFLTHAIDQEREQKAWELWTALYPSMNIGTLSFIKFEDFKKRLFNPQQKYSQKSKSDILAEMTALAEANRGR
ncbi:MAG: hypothetical protein M0P69_13545 [Bacteroidales bacterium]|jgi:hypothetical protein|nr:hypothetical protein [Bacteroidales bacterium]